MPETASLQFELADSSPTVQADAAQVRQAGVNLVVNAAEALGERGSIRVATRTVQADRAFLERTYLPAELAEGLYVCLDVTDDGHGMDETTRARIFEPFFSTKFPGRGLGLAAVLGIVRGHRGAVKVDSQLGKGTSIQILFPVSSASPGA